MAQAAAAGVHLRLHPHRRRDNRGPGPISPGTEVTGQVRIRSESSPVYYVRSLRSGNYTTACSFATGRTGESGIFFGMHQIPDKQLPREHQTRSSFGSSAKEMGNEEEKREARKRECPITITTTNQELSVPFSSQSSESQEWPKVPDAY